MAKDVAQLREEEAKKERDRIAKIKIEEPEKATQVPTSQQPQPVQGLKTQSGSERPIPPSLMPHAQVQKPIFVRARTRSEKVLIRIIVIGILLFILLNGFAFGYWYFTRKAVVQVIPTPQPTPPAKVEEPTAQPPAPETLVFFDTAQEKTITLGATDTLIALLSGALKEEYPQGFTRILIKKEGGAFVTFREFLNKTDVSMPESLLLLLKEDFMLFVYSSPDKKRLGVIGELALTEGVEGLLRNWETTLEQDTKPLWEIVGQKGSSYTPFFRQAVHQNNLVRFQTFSAVDFGVVYTLFGSKLILSTSFESLTKAVDQILQSR